MNISVPKGHYQTQGWLSIIPQTWHTAVCVCVNQPIHFPQSHGAKVENSVRWMLMVTPGVFKHIHTTRLIPAPPTPPRETKAIICPYVCARSCVAAGHCRLSALPCHPVGGDGQRWVAPVSHLNLFRGCWPYGAHWKGARTANRNTQESTLKRPFGVFCLTERTGGCGIMRKCAAWGGAGPNGSIRVTGPMFL